MDSNREKSTREFEKKRLSKDINHSLNMFDSFANMAPLERNKLAIEVLEEFLSQAKKLQVEFVQWKEKND